MEEQNASRLLAVSLAKASSILSSVAWDTLANQAGLIWTWVRSYVLLPMVWTAVVSCLVMSVVLLLEKVLMGLVSLYVKVFRRKPEKIYKWQPIQADEELGSSVYPMVLVQIPMFNEREVYKMSIGAACSLAWPSDRLVIQVLDDSTDLTILEMVQSECEKWKTKGINVDYITRDNRNGYKAGAMNEAMKIDYVQQCDYVAIFDADFQPGSDFLMRTVPFLMHNPELALVQTRWKFLNADECLMTRIQEISLNYHFKIEQQSGSSIIEFFGFNGTAGVWRIKAMNEVEGWKERTTVEDMDLAVRATLAGWKFLYVGSVKVKNELPSTFKAYRFQQHRWSCGPANLFKKMTMEIITAKKVPITKKFFLVYSFFFSRKIIAHYVTFFFYCVVIPVSCFFPEIQIPKWGVVYIPTVITLLMAVATPGSIHLIIFWILFENVMSWHRCKAVYNGLTEAKRVNEWIVTEKIGEKMKKKPPSAAAAAAAAAATTTPVKKSKSKSSDRFHFDEIGIGIFLIVCATYDLAYNTDRYFMYIYPLALSFIILGVGYAGTFIPSGK